MHELTLKIKEIIDTPDNEVNIGEAALVLLKVNRNRTLHDSIIRRNNVEKLKYELKKIYEFRFRSEATEEVNILEKEAVSIIENTLPVNQRIEESETKGKREDHDRLPDEIKALYLENFNHFPLMRKLHEQLKLMSNSLPCDRYPLLKKLKELDAKIRQNWDSYDEFVLPAAPIVPPVVEKTEPSAKEEPPTVVDANSENPETPAVEAKTINAARKYLSDNKGKLRDLKAQEDPAKYRALLVKMQERLDLLLRANAGVTDDYLKELKDLGLNA